MLRRLLKVPCEIQVTDAHANDQLRGLLDLYFADAVDPIDFLCPRCGLKWERSGTSDWERTTCSNCYNDHVVLIACNVEFANWGEHNGGDKEMDQRYHAARQLCMVKENR